MIEQEHYNQLYDQLLLLFQNPLLKGLPFFTDFKDKWMNILSDNIHNPIIACTDSEQDNQVYTQNLILDSGFSFELHYDILLLQAFYYKEKGTVSTYFLAHAI